MSQVLLSPRAYDNELMSELTEQAVLECDVSGLTVFPRIDAAAFIYFVVQFGAATIRGRRLLLWEVCPRHVTSIPSQLPVSTSW